MKQTLRILHLEDNKHDAELIHEKLAAEAIECDVTLVDTREGFISAVEQGGFDIILADYKLPSFDGMSALKLANEKCPEVPFIFISGTIGEDTAVEALKSGATDYIIKDRLSRLASAVNRALQEAESGRERKRAEGELVRLYQQVKEEAEVSGSLLQMVEALNRSLDERELIKTVTQLAPHYLKFDRIAIFLLDEDVKSFMFSGGYGFSPVEEGILLSRNFKSGDFPAMDKAIAGETVIVENGRETDLISKELVDTFGIMGAVIVPIIAREKVIGGIYADYKTLRPIEKREVSFLKGLADGIAIALQNSRLYRDSVKKLMELQGKIGTIKAMSQLDKEILSSIDRNTVLRTAAALINKVVPCDRVGIVLREGDRCAVVSEWGAGDFRDKTYTIKGSHLEAFDRNRAAVYIDDVTRDDCPYHKSQREIGIVSSLLIPLVTKEGVVGFLDIGLTHPGRLTPEHLMTAENIASQISVALENSRLYDELQQLLVSTIKSLASAIDAKSPWTQGHSERVTQYALQIGGEMGLKEEELERLKLSGLLHDVGKIGTYDILLDKPSKLTDEEFALVKKHPGKGAEDPGAYTAIKRCHSRCPLPSRAI